jgi:type I restriction enzyme S subunit
MNNNTDKTPTKRHNNENIPQGWSSLAINQVFEFIGTSSFSRNDLNYEVDNDSIYYIHYGDIHATYKNAVLDFNTETRIPVLNKDIKPSTYFLKNGDLIIADASEDYEGVGEALEVYNVDDKKVLAGLHTFALRDKNNKTAHGYRAYLFKNAEVKKRLKTIATGSKVYGISKGNLEKFKITLPPLPEQQKIAKILATWDKAFALQQKLIVEKKQYKKAVMKKLLTGEVRFKGFTEKWKELRLKDVLKYERPDQFIVNSDVYSNNHKTPVLTANKGFVLGYTDETKGIYTDLPIILFDDFTTDNKFVEFPFKIKSSAIKILKTSNEGFDLKFIYERMQIFSFPKEEHKRYYISEYQYLKFNCPELNEQNKISNYSIDLDKEINALEKQLFAMQEQKQGLMQQLLTGKVRVKN